MSSRSEEIIWEEPPPTSRSNATRTIWERRLVPLLDRPNTWARVFTSEKKGSAKSTVNSLNKGQLQLPRNSLPSDWEFQYSDHGAEGSAVYARFVGDLASLGDISSLGGPDTKAPKETKYSNEPQNKASVSAPGTASSGTASPAMGDSPPQTGVLTSGGQILTESEYAKVESESPPTHPLKTGESKVPVSGAADSTSKKAAVSDESKANASGEGEGAATPDDDPLSDLDSILNP